LQTVADRKPLDKEEFLALSNQKADDWRELTSISASFLGVAGVFFTAGVAKEASWVIVMAPVPLFLGVWYMIQSARLQLQMITYLSVFSPFAETSWEKDIAKVRPYFWETAEKGLLTSRIEQIKRVDGPALARHLANPSSWDVWWILAVLVALGVDSIPLFMGFEDKDWAFAVGLLSTLVFSALVWRSGKHVESERKRWEETWEQYKRRELDHL
jgi:hypothetical protein